MIGSSYKTLLFYFLQFCNKRQVTSLAKGEGGRNFFTLFNRMTLSCNPSIARSLSFSISWEEYDDDALIPPSSMPSNRMALVLRWSLHKRFPSIRQAHTIFSQNTTINLKQSSNWFFIIPCDFSIFVIDSQHFIIDCTRKFQLESVSYFWKLNALLFNLTIKCNMSNKFPTPKNINVAFVKA